MPYNEIGISNTAPIDITSTDKPNDECLTIICFDKTKNNPKHVKFIKIKTSPTNKSLVKSNLSISIKVSAPAIATIIDNVL